MESKKRVAIYAISPPNITRVESLPPPLLPSNAARSSLSAFGFHIIFEGLDAKDTFNQWNIILDMAKKRLIDVIAFPNFTDVPLSASETSHVELDLRERGVSLLVLSEMVDTSCSLGFLIFNIMLAHRDYQRADGSNR